MIFDIEEHQGAWFDLKDGGRVQLRLLSAADWREIKKKTESKGLPEYPKLDGEYKRFQPVIVDDDLQMELMWDKTIINWEKLFDKNNKPIPCTMEWKTKLMLMTDGVFREFYSDKIKGMTEAENKKKESELKN
jgi:hypothetical protein